MHYGKKNPLDDKNLILFDWRHFCMNSINRSQSHFVLCKTVATPKWTTVLPDKKVFKRDTTFKRFAIQVLSMYFYLSLFSHTQYTDQGCENARKKVDLWKKRDTTT